MSVDRAGLLHKHFGFVVSFGCLGGRTSRASLHAYSVFHVKASEVRGKYGYTTNKPHYGFVVYPLFVFYILNTHIVNRMAVSLFIGQGWRATLTLSPSDEQEANAKGVAFSSDRCLS